MPILVSDTFRRISLGMFEISAKRATTFVPRTRRQHINLTQVRYNDECLAIKPKKVVYVCNTVIELFGLTVFFVHLWFFLYFMHNYRKKLWIKSQEVKGGKTVTVHTEQKDAYTLRYTPHSKMNNHRMNISDNKTKKCQ